MKENSLVFIELARKSPYSLNQLSRVMFISPTSMQNYLTGKRSPDLRALFDLCCICDYDFGLVPIFQLKDLEISFNRFYYKLSDEKKAEYIKGMSRFTSSNNKNLDYLMSDIKAIYLSHKDTPELTNPDLEARVKSLEIEVATLKTQIELICKLTHLTKRGSK